MINMSHSELRFGITRSERRAETLKILQKAATERAAATRGHVAGKWGGSGRHDRPLHPQL
jgi:hypothetical protein